MSIRATIARHWSIVATLIGIIGGVAIGLLLKFRTSQPWTERDIMYLQFPGELFLRAINCLILPLISSSIVSASYALSKSGKIGLKALYYYIATTTIGIITSVILVQTIQPGKILSDTSAGQRNEKPQHHVTMDVVLDLFRNLIPENMISAFVEQYQTFLLRDDTVNETEANNLPIMNRSIRGANVLGIVFFSLLLGIVIGLFDTEDNAVYKLCSALSAATMKMMEYVTKFTPLAILFLMPGKILEIDDFTEMMSQLGAYVGTVFLGITIHGVFSLPFLYLICTRKSAYKLLSQMGPALVTAFGTSSSTATVPMTLKCLDKSGIDGRISRFVVPIGAAINLDGIALYESIGAMFIVQMRGLDFSLAQMVVLSVTCALSCIGAAGLPSGGYVMLILVLNSVGISSDDVTLIIAIDSFVDRFRTLLNIVTDTIGSGIISHLCKSDLDAEANVQEPLNALQNLETKL